MTLSPRESAKFVADLSTHVKIRREGVETLGLELSEAINSGTFSADLFSQTNVHPKPHDPWAVDWLFVVDALNFCFWSYEHEEGWTVEGQTGYFALCAAINRALKENIDILNPRFYSTITEEKLAGILRSDNKAQVPLLKDRVKVLQEVGAALLENYEGTFRNCLKKANNSAVKLLEIIVDGFRCFRDEAHYKNRKVSIYKRAQILIGDIWACHKNQGPGYFHDIQEITMFADYRVPQVLLYFNVLEYSEELKRNLKSNVILENGCEMEVEIRGCSVHAVELLTQFIRKRVDQSKGVNAVIVDHYLWDFRRKHAKEILQNVLPFHKTFSIFY